MNEGNGKDTHLRGINSRLGGGYGDRLGGVEESRGGVCSSHGLPVGAHPHATHPHIVARVRVKVGEGVGGLRACVHLKQ